MSLFVCALPLVKWNAIQHLVHSIILSSVACVSVQYFLSHCLTKQKDFLNNVLNIKRRFRFSLQLCLKIPFILRNIQGGVISLQKTMCRSSSILILFQLFMNFLLIISKNSNISFHPVLRRSLKLYANIQKACENSGLLKGR